MKILSATQIRELDAQTIQQEPISSIELMERASRTVVNWFLQKFQDTEAQPVYIFCGLGNNGGDGLAIARLLHRRFYEVKVYCCKVSETMSRDARLNYARLRKIRGVHLEDIELGDDFPDLSDDGIIVDAIFGSGLNREVENYWGTLIDYISESGATRVAIDLPSGLFADKHSIGATFKAHYTLSFELPKLAFFLPENQDEVGTWHISPIGLDALALAKMETPFHYITTDLVRPILYNRQKYDHKGTFGHALMIAGAYGKVGAAILATRASLRAGAGLATIHAPRCAYQIAQISFPEAMVSVDEHEFIFTSPPDLSPYAAIGVGPGIGTNALTVKALEQLIDDASSPLVLDADALNIIGKNKKLLKLLPKNSLLTPHPKEFERLFGKTANDFERLDRLREKAQLHNIYIILKGAHTSIATPDGAVYFNSTGNPGMATGGSGDVLTGMLTGLLAQEYNPLEASLLGVYLHGLAGDIAAEALQQEALLASDIIDCLGRGFRALRG